MSNITGGEPVKRILQATDQDMKDIRAMQNAGFGLPGPTRDPVSAMAAINSIRSSSAETRGQRYNAWKKNADAVLSSNHPYARDARGRANAAYTQRFSNSSPSVSQVHTDQSISELSTQYGNDEFIGEDLMPAVLVPKKSNIFYTYNKSDRFQSPSDDVIAENGEAPEITESRSTDSYACVDRGFKNHIAANNVANQDAPLDELFDLTEALMDHRALRREQRIATVLTTSTNYDSANRRTLSGAEQWNSASGGNPIEAMQTADAALFRGRSAAQTKCFSSLEIFNQLSRHDDILGLFQFSGTGVGLATPGMIARFLGWDDYLVGRAREVTSTEGDADVYARIWGDFFGVLRVANRQTIRSATFGCTMRWTMDGVPGANQGLLTQQWFDMTKGLGGTHYAKAGESEDHKVQADDCGYLISDTLA